MISKSFGLLFYLKKPKGYSNGECPIYLRITADGISKEMTVKRTWLPEEWDGDTGRPITSKKINNSSLDYANAQQLDAFLETLRAKAHEAKHALIIHGKPVTALGIRNILQGRSEIAKSKMLMDVFSHHNERIKSLVGIEYSAGTLVKFKTVFRHTREFMKWKYGIEDIDVKKLNFEFIKDLEF